MQTYDLRFKDRPNARSYWSSTIYAENDEEAIAKVEELRKDGKHYKCKLGKIKYSFRNIYKWED